MEYREHRELGWEIKHVDRQAQRTPASKSSEMHDVGRC
jgi:hypothetical protein